MVTSMAESVDKEMYVVGLLLSNPALTINDVNYAVHHKFHHGMRKDKILQIRRVVNAKPEIVKPQYEKYQQQKQLENSQDAHLKELLQKAYNYFKQQDITKLVITDNDIMLFTEIERVIV